LTTLGTPRPKPTESEITFDAIVRLLNVMEIYGSRGRMRPDATLDSTKETWFPWMT